MQSKVVSSSSFTKCRQISSNFFTFVHFCRCCFFSSEIPEKLKTNWKTVTTTASAATASLLIKLNLTRRPKCDCEHFSFAFHLFASFLCPMFALDWLCLCVFTTPFKCPIFFLFLFNNIGNSINFKPQLVLAKAKEVIYSSNQWQLLCCSLMDSVCSVCRCGFFKKERRKQKTDFTLL